MPGGPSGDSFDKQRSIRISPYINERKVGGEPLNLFDIPTGK